MSTQPGQIALQVMPVEAVSSATTLVRPTSPCLAATYADFSTEATSPCAEAMLTMRPQLRCFIAGNAMRIAWKAADRFNAITASQRSIGKRSTGATYWIPALFTRMSTPPWRASMCENIASISSGFERSAPS